MKNGYFLISLDFELLWGMAGWNNREINRYLPHIENSISALSRILMVFDTYHIKCDIACVGGMALQNVQQFLSAAPWVKPYYVHAQFSCYESLVPFIGTIYREELFFCPDTIILLSKRKNVKISTHTFSHYYCLEEGQTTDQFREDLKTALAVFRKRGIYIDTIVFPRNQVSEEYLKVCWEEGLTHYRGSPKNILYKP